MLFYIDYLDHITSGSRSFKPLELRLRFDLLVFGKDTLCMSVPACIKLEETTNLLIKLDDFWKNGKIRLQLDEKHKGNPRNYFNNRKRVLEKGISEEKLSSHFEYAAYQNKRTTNFFGTYFPEMLSVSSNEIYIGKDNDTDALFRRDSVDLLEKHYDPVCKVLDPNRSIIFTGIINRIHGFALDQTSLFQRALIEDTIVAEFNPKSNERLVIATLLDRAFALANAETSNAIPLSLVLNQLTGKWLHRLIYKSYGQLYHLICNLTWAEVYELSQNDDWRNFIGFINAFIALVQHSNVEDYPAEIETYTKRLTHSVSLLNLLHFAKEEAISAMKDKLFEFGLFSEAFNLEGTVDLLASCYAGKYSSLINVVSAIDIYAKRVIENLTKIKKLAPFLTLSDKEKEYEILK